MAETAIAKSSSLDEQTMLMLVAGGDCSRLTAQQKISYYNARCEAAGLDPRAQPFAFMRLSGKEVLYALKAATDQLASKHGIVTTILSQQTEDGIRVVTVRSSAKDGRQTDEIGAVAVKGLQGEAMCNALMKAVTKAKRRAILSICGLGLLDETELDTVPHAAPVRAVNEPREMARPRDLAEDDNTRRQAAQIAAAAEELQGSVEVNPDSQRVRLVWKRASNPKTHNMTPEMFAAFVEKTLGSKKRSLDWTAEDMDQLENALDKEEEIP